VFLGSQTQERHVSYAAVLDARCVVMYRFPSSSVPAEVYTTVPLGDATILHLKVGDKLLKALVAATFEGDAGTKVVIGFPPDRMHLFDRGSGRAIG